ncbi:MAG: exodeoxyribonuclease V subunit gamma [Pseudohongiellaceae bacterium]
MALHLISSNRVERLQSALALQLAEEPPPSPFHAEQIIVPGMAMARWLNLQLARTLGIASHIEYRLPAHWIWETLRGVLPEVPDRDPLDREMATWRLFAILPEQMDRPECAALSRYLEDDGDGVKRWQLAGRIADVFDRYQFYRPDWIRDWTAGGAAGAGRDHPWQPLLWRALTENLDGAHRVALIDRLPQALPGATGVLPERVSLFALSSLPPLFVDVFRELAGHTEVLFFQHSPTDQYWADLLSEKQAARQRLHEPDRALYTETGDELLVSWGRQGQAFQDLLLDSDLLDQGPREIYQVQEGDRLLHHLQRRLYEAEAARGPLPVDDSLSVHICHSPLRECQVLHDHLLNELERDDSLKPEDILVMVPEISRYAPYIEAVFRRDENDSRPFIPWNLSDITVADERPLLRVFLQLLALPDSRLHWSEVMSLLEVPEVASRFGLSADDVDSLAEAMDGARARWGLDAAHRQAMDLPPHPQNTWAHALDRLMAAHALGPGFEDGAAAGQTLWQGVAAAPHVTGPQALGRFAQLLDRLGDWRGHLTGEYSAVEWQEHINALLEQFFRVTADDDDPLQAVRDVLATLVEAAGSQPLSGAVVRLWLEQQLGSSTQRGRYFSGGVTFCGMRPMRSMPFRIIGLLGMDDAVFPRRDRPAEFDGMADGWRPGDPGKGEEDRYLMLETLLSARDQLYISYVGRSLQSNEPRQPSTLIQELMDQVTSDMPTESALRMSGTVHPMQPFSPDNFRPPAPLSHDRFWYAVARSLPESGTWRESTPCWPGDPLPLPDELEGPVELAALHRFLRNPVRTFFRDRLKIRFDEDEENEDVEPFDVGGLQSWQLRQRMIRGALQGRSLPRDVLVAEGVLPHGHVADVVLDRTQDRAAAVLDSVSEYTEKIPETRHVSVTLPGGSTLNGQVDACYPGLGRLSVTPSGFKGDQLLSLWLDHLALCGSGELAGDETSLLVTGDGKSCRLPAVGQDEARAELAELAGLYREGLRRPLPVARYGSYAMARNESRDEVDKGRRAAAGCWKPDNDWNRDSDATDIHLQAVVHAGACLPHEAEEFRDIAWRLYGPIAGFMPGGQLP